jgi:hypothetical protein
MRSFPAILLAALTVVVIGASALLTASHFGMRDWPTPPMPDTATRLITPTEAATKARERLSKGDDPAEVTIAGDAGAQARRSERPATGATSRRAATRTRRGARNGRHSGERRSGHHGDGRHQTPPAQSGDDAGTAPPSTPAATQPAPAAPVTQAAAGEQTQARPDDTATPPATEPAIPAPSLPPIVPPLPTTPAPSGDDGSGDDSPGRGHGRRRGPIRNLLDHLL